MSEAARKLTIVRTDRDGVALDTDTSADVVDQMKGTLAIYDKGYVAGYADALMSTGVVPRSTVHRDELMASYRETAAKRCAEKKGAA